MIFEFNNLVDENNEGEDGNVSLTRNKKFKKAYETNEYMKLTKVNLFTCFLISFYFLIYRMVILGIESSNENV